MKTPIIIVNFKTYNESTGENSLNLAKICDKLSKQTQASIAVAVQTAEINKISESISIPVLSQHIDPITPGRNTGFILPESVKQAGAKATIINHSEHRLDFETLKQSIEKAKQINLKVVACAKDADDAKKIASLNPDFIAVEPPELIGGDISVSTAKPEVIEDSVKAIKSVNPDIKVLCGAGVKNSDDVRKAIELGSQGILVASGIVKAENQEQAIKDLINGLIS
ncbi:MAG: triose-phosphate isomerase [Candidatus Nanoarchaeia archaeon]|nr:triose-phosphate isomerase [Candidatus Nanoarchaeia archaeon]